MISSRRSRVSVPRAAPDRARAIGAVIVGLGSLALGFVPLFAGPGYESSLGAGLIVPPVAAVSVALARGRRALPPTAAVAEGAWCGLAFGAIAYVMTLAHGLRSGFCSFWGGTLLFALGPFAGEVAARVERRRRRVAVAIVAGLAGPWSTIAWGLLAAYLTPVVFAFDPFFGFFSGTLYDTVIDGAARLATYRLGTLASLLAVAGAARSVARDAAGRLARARPRPSAWSPVLTACAAAAALTVTALGSRLGHWQTASTIADELGAAREGALCRVVYPRTMRDAQAALFVRDCDQDLASVAAYLGVDRPPRVTAFLFADSAQKRRLMGAAETYVAKPWRGEVYVQATGYPHPVLGHELAHVLAASFAPGPMHVAGRLGGLVPDPGLIEGLATDASPDDAFTSRGWAHAMLELGLLPPLRAVFSFGFLARNASVSYTAAGAFVGYVHRRYGADVVRRWYGGASLESVVHASLATIERDFRADLLATPLPEGAIEVARARFDRPAIFGRTCPHERDADRKEAGARFSIGDVRGAEALYDRLARDDRHDGSARLGRAACVARLDGAAAASALLVPMIDDAALNRPTRDQAEERLGDLALAAGDVVAAKAHYDAVAARTTDEDALRTLDVKRAALGSDVARQGVVAYLIGKPATGPDAAAAAEALTRWAMSPGADGLAHYLLGRAAMSRADYELASAHLDEAIKRGTDLARVAREAARQRVIAGCALADAGGVGDGLQAWSAAGGGVTQRDVALRALASRCLAPLRSCCSVSSPGATWYPSRDDDAHKRAVGGTLARLRCRVRRRFECRR